MRFMRYIAQWKSAAKEALDRTAITAKFLCCLHFTNNYLCSLTHVYGPSMLPTLNLAGDVVIAEHLSPRLGNLDHGDLVLVRSPLNPNRSLTKRIVGMEGDTITYFDPLRADSTQTQIVPKGHVWIQGDNIYASHDSRHFGPVPYGLIQGKVFFRVWPLDSFGLLGQ
ncbi:mitochondrial ATP-independent inner membrane protease subunit 1a-like isoform X2 [Gastrolobium bilobum]|uniref:mitochondrial ATP-independent inner membrane protease subunit 1a-like isoform X2 n=1 Tax=Gastrolobium bilobum TaxID=150636 RepID=UPI002AB03B3B|nr:mitochondrial ATP-independent inner membrane protease subunit 1a-like isoform X2 [Gastrolobium bilobum]